MTNLYKSAAASHDKAKALGYQDALDDLLSFLDKEDLGLMDGEGWRVRQWATERLVNDGVTKKVGSDEEDESNNDEQRAVSPQARRTSPALPTASSATEEISPRRSAVSEPPQPQPQPQLQPQLQPIPSDSESAVPSLDDFTFRNTSHTYPSGHDREQSMDLDSASSTTNSSDTVRPLTRTARSRHTNHQRQRGTTINLNLGPGAGSKRKMPYSDFFDISGFSAFDGQDRKDGGNGRGGKRGRQV